MRYFCLTPALTTTLGRFCRGTNAANPPRHIAICRAVGRGSFHALILSQPLLKLWLGHAPFHFSLYTIHRCVPITSTGVNRRDRHLCIRTRPRSGRGTSAAFCNHGIRGMPRSNIRWPTGHSEGASTGGAHGNRWGRNPPRRFIGESFAKSHPRQMKNGARQNCQNKRGKTAAPDNSPS